MGFSRQEHWSRLPFPSAGDLPGPGVEPGSPALQAHSLLAEPQGKPQRTIRRILKKLNIELPCNPVILLLHIYPEEIKIEKDTRPPMFIAALYTMSRTWKQPGCPSTDEWIKKLWYIYMME